MDILNNDRRLIFPRQIFQNLFLSIVLKNNKNVNLKN